MGRKDVQVLAVCPRNAQRLEHAKNRVDESYAKRTTSGSFQGCTAYRDFRELLARDDIDAVLIATAPPTCTP